MAKVEVVDSGIVDRRDSAFPTLVRLDNGDVVCGYSVGGGPEATGGTDWARSTDGGRSWKHEGTILPRTENPNTSNSLRLSRTADGAVLAYGGRTHYLESAMSEGELKRQGFGLEKNEPVFCRSDDGCRTWSDPQVIPRDSACVLGVANPIVVLADGRWLAPAGLLPSPDRYGEQVIVFESEDHGQTWPRTRVVLEDAKKKYGYLEQKLIELEPGTVMAIAWTVTFGDYQDMENHFCLSYDGGQTWGAPRSTGIYGQTMTPTWLGGNRLMLTYNRRAGHQAVMMALVRFTEAQWQVEYEGVLWDAKANYRCAKDDETGIDEFAAFKFGLPSAMRLDEENFLAVHWCVEDSIHCIRWTRLRLS